MYRTIVVFFYALCASCGGVNPQSPPPRTPQPPNVLLYVIDGGGADLMSVYGYGRPTTPLIEALAKEGVLFEAARTNSAWTKPSTASFMTSLHHSVLGGFTTNEDHIPKDAVTMAQHFSGAGYQTGVFTSNPFAGSMSGLQRGVDVFRDHGATSNSTSSVELHGDFWAWRTAQEDGPWWAHIQTTDVHEPHAPVAPYAGRYASQERRTRFEAWWAGIHELSDIQRDTVLGRYQAQLEKLGVNPKDFFRTQWDLYDETMMHNDASLSAFVSELKAKGEWDNTVFILTADHGHPAGSFSRFGRGLIEPAPADWEGALADSYRTHVPLLVIWPEQLPAGKRVQEPVSLIDLLPTVLDLAQLPPATVRQGRSWRPLLTDSGEWTPQPLVLEQVQAYPPTGEMVGHIEVIDGQWAASLEVMPKTLVPVAKEVQSLDTAGGWRAARPHRFSTPKLLLYDLSVDPFCTQNVNTKYPERVDTYTRMLTTLWEDHQTLANSFQSGGVGVMDEAQREALRTLGYIE